MAVYTIGKNNTYSTLSPRFIIDNSAIMTYRLAKLFKFKEDKFCTDLLLEYETRHNVKWKKNRYNNLCRLKKIFGIRLGWHLWFIYYFVYKYGFEAGNINYVYNRKKVKENSDNIVKVAESDQYKVKKYKIQQACKPKEVRKLEKMISGKIVTYKLLNMVMLNFGKCLPKSLIDKIKQDIERKKDKIVDLNQSRNAILRLQYDRFRALCLSGKNED